MTRAGGAGRTVVILGAGVGGVVAANVLRRRLPPTDRVVLIDRERYHVFQPSLLWVAVGWRDADRIRRPLERLRRKGIDVVNAEITRIDLDSGRVIANAADYAWDALIIALGAELAAESVPGLAVAGHNLYTLGGAEGIWSAVQNIRSGRIVVLTAAPAYKCPAAPYEAALLIDGALRRRGVRDAVAVELYAAEPGPMGVAGPEVSASVRGLVESRAIAYHPEHPVASVDASNKRIAFASGATAEFDVLAYVPPHRAPAVVRDAGLTNESGWIPVDRGTLETKFPRVFAIGDVTTIPLSLGKPLPKAGVFARAQAEVVATNVAHSWTGVGERHVFDGHGACFVETGDGRAGFGAGNFYGEPRPRVRLRRPSRLWHWAKVLVEKRWLTRWF